MISKTAPPRATRREWIGLAVIALPCVLYSMDLTVLFLAIPSLSRDLNPSATQLLWISDVYGFMVAGSLITMGTLGDRIGRRKLLLLGAALFGSASVAAAFSTSAEMLIATRALLGIAGATVAPSTLSLIRNMFDDEGQRTFAIGIWVTSYSVGALIGPVLGGVFLEYFWWGSVFLLAVPVMLLILVVGPRLLPEYRDPNAGRIDLFSAAQSTVAVLGVIYGIKRIAADGVSAVPVAAILVGITVGVFFIRRQQRLEDPFIDLSLFRNAAFSASLATYLLTVFMLFGVGLFIAQYFQLVAGLSPLRAGLWTLPSSAAFIIGSLSSSMIVKRFRPAYVMAGCLLLTAVGFAVIAQVHGPDDILLVVAGALIYGIAAAPVVTLATDIVVGSAPPERAGAASAISETSAELGGALSIAILGSIGTAVYRAHLGGGTGAMVPQTAEEKVAFVRAFDVVATTSLILALGTGIMAAILLRHLPARGGPPEQPAPAPSPS